MLPSILIASLRMGLPLLEKCVAISALSFPPVPISHAHVQLAITVPTIAHHLTITYAPFRLSSFRQLRNFLRPFFGNIQQWFQSSKERDRQWVDPLTWWTEHRVVNIEIRKIAWYCNVCWFQSLVLWRSLYCFYSFYSESRVASFHPTLASMNQDMRVESLKTWFELLNWVLALQLFSILGVWHLVGLSIVPWETGAFSLRFAIEPCCPTAGGINGLFSLWYYLRAWKH